MRRKLGRDLAGGAEGGLIQCIEILANRAGRIGWINLRDVPVLLRRRVLLVGIRFDETGIDRHALAADEALLDAPRYGRSEQVAEQFAVTEPSVSVLRERRVIRDPVTQVKAAEPAIGEVEMDLLTQPPLRSDPEAIADQQHPDKQLGIDGGTAGVAVEICKMGTDAADVDEPVDGSK
jgi:hypothetical protein